MSVARHCVGLLMAAMAVGCSSTSPKHEPTAPPQAAFSVEEVRAEALRDASAAIARGQLYVCEAGTIRLYVPGVPEHELALVRELPRVALPSGCTEPQAFRSIAYAEAFNAEILRHLSKPTN